MKRILIVGSQHGDELLGVRLYEYIKDVYPDILTNIEYVCANPLAFAKNVRFTESDMNRSYNITKTTRESALATKLDQKIRRGKYDYVLDCHTTTTEVGCCFIVSEFSEVQKQIINASACINKILLIPESISKNSLIGVIKNSISIECEQSLSTTADVLEELAAMVNRLSKGLSSPATTRHLYKVSSFIDASSLKDGVVLQNYEECDGKYPVLCGGDMSTRTYRGFWADSRQQVSL